MTLKNEAESRRGPEEKQATGRAPLPQRLMYPLLLSATLGQSMFYIILSWMTLKVTGNIASVGLVLVWRPLLSVAIGPLIGVLVDRFDRSKLFILGQGLKVAGTGFLFYCVQGQALAGLEFLHLCISACVVFLGILLTAPTSQALLQATDGGSVTRVVTIGVGVVQGGDILGVLAGGLAIAILGFEASLVISAVFSVVAVGFAIPLRVRTASQAGVPQIPYASALAEGFKLILRDALLLTACLAIALIWSTSQVTMALLAAFTWFELRLGADAYGWIDAMWGVGTIAGSAILLYFAKPGVHHFLLKFGLPLLALATLGFSLSQELWVAMLLHGCMGLAFALNRTAYDAYILTTVHSDLVGRVRNNIDAVIGLVGVIVYLSPSLYTGQSVRVIYIGFAAALAVAALGLMGWRLHLAATRKTSVSLAQPET